MAITIKTRGKEETVAQVLRRLLVVMSTYWLVCLAIFLCTDFRQVPRQALTSLAIRFDGASAPAQVISRVANRVKGTTNSFDVTYGFSTTDGVAYTHTQRIAPITLETSPLPTEVRYSRRFPALSAIHPAAHADFAANLLMLSGIITLMYGAFLAMILGSRFLLAWLREVRRRRAELHGGRARPSPLP